ncbi:hypothetical protein [Abyssogena phaseoliformis symbiont]|uniref:hypothetical protein n=1 Tax=Abyssogena phaseoliformis symbiont TaxID=596095 RepID=UPI001915853B|nr:hypothetical protein [Abyssogena phaseoliformis symbiont]
MMAAGLAGVGQIGLSQSLLLEAPEEITSEKFKEIISSNNFRYFVLNEGRLLLVKLKL